MPSYKKNSSIASNEEMMLIRETLELMVQDASYNTKPSFSANTERYPDNLIPFIDKHLDYLMTHKSVNPQQYISNLRLMTRLTR